MSSQTTVSIVQKQIIENEPQDKSQSKSSKIDDYIGSGGFGKVYEIKGTNLVKKEMDLRHEENIREICFLSTYKHIPFITQINKCEIDSVKKTINLFMEYAGLSLRDLSKKLNIEAKFGPEDKEKEAEDENMSS